MRRAHALIASLALGPAGQVLQLVDEHRPLGLPQWQARSHLVVKDEQLQLLAQCAVVALFGLLQHRQMVVEGFAGGKGRAVDPLQHLAALVAAPIGSSHAQELEVPDLSGAEHVRPPAQVDELAVFVKGQGLALFQVGEDLPFVGSVGDHLFRFLTRNIDPLELVVLLDDPLHLALDFFQVLGRKRLGHVEIVVEAVVNGRTDRQLRVREEAQHGLRQHVRHAVAVDPSGLVRIPRDELDFGLAVERGVEVDVLVASASGNVLLQQRLVLLDEDFLERTLAGVFDGLSLGNLNQHDALLGMKKPAVIVADSGERLQNKL